MTKTQIVNEICANSKFIKKDVTEIIDKFLAKIKADVENGNQVEIRGFGSFYLASKKARKVTSPIAKRVIDVPEKTILAFKGSKETEKEITKGA